MFSRGNESRVDPQRGTETGERCAQPAEEISASAIERTERTENVARRRAARPAEPDGLDLSLPNHSQFRSTLLAVDPSSHDRRFVLVQLRRRSVRSGQRLGNARLDLLLDVRLHSIVAAFSFVRCESAMAADRTLLPLHRRFLLVTNVSRFSSVQEREIRRKFRQHFRFDDVRLSPTDFRQSGRRFESVEDQLLNFVLFSGISSRKSFSNDLRGHGDLGSTESVPHSKSIRRTSLEVFAASLRFPPFDKEIPSPPRFDPSADKIFHLELHEQHHLPRSRRSIFGNYQTFARGQTARLRTIVGGAQTRTGNPHVPIASSVVRSNLSRVHFVNSSLFVFAH